MPPQVQHVSRLRSALASLAPDVGRANEVTRARWLESALQRIPAGSRILDAGAGTQRWRRLCGHLDYVSQDIAEYDGAGDSTGLQTGNFDFGKLDIVSDIAAIPEPDASFDAIMCIEVLEHVADPVAAIREFKRLLRPGGYLVVTSPFASLTHFAPYHYSSGLSRYWYDLHLAANGFDGVEIVANGNFFEFLAQEIYRLRLVSKEYTSRGPGPIGLLAMYVMLRMLRRFSRADTRSSELLCFGHHVFARRAS